MDLPSTLIPPVSLIRESKIGWNVEDMEFQFRQIGEDLAENLKKMGGLKPTEDALDVGCGIGRVARPLTSYLSTGTYTGIDIVKASIDWCREAYKPYANFRFEHAEIFSTTYNTTAKVTAENYRFPFPDQSFDLIFSCSLFTHLQIAAVENYLSEMVRMLRPGGRVYNSYLLLDEHSEPLVVKPRPDARHLFHKVPGGRIRELKNPEALVGLDLDLVKAAHQQRGLEITLVELTNWSGGRDTPLKGQDVIVARKRE